MDLEEALLQMDLLGHEILYLCVDVEDQTTNVLSSRMVSWFLLSKES